MDQMLGMFAKFLKNSWTRNLANLQTAWSKLRILHLCYLKMKL